MEIGATFTAAALNWYVLIKRIFNQRRGSAPNLYRKREMYLNVLRNYQDYIQIFGI